MEYLYVAGVWWIFTDFFTFPISVCEPVSKHARIVKMIFDRITLIWHIVALILFKNGSTFADSGEDFLNAVINRLKQERYSDENYNPIEDIFGEIRRSVKDYKVEDEASVNM